MRSRWLPPWTLHCTATGGKSCPSLTTAVRASLHQRLKAEVNQQVADRGHEGGAGDGEDPREHDALAPDPSDGADALGGADAEDRASDGVGGGDGDAALG